MAVELGMLPSEFEERATSADFWELSAFLKMRTEAEAEARKKAQREAERNARRR